ncbi:NADH-quinone oxidoreductase subunit G [Kineosporia sp. R_H_3]|uniref:NADH-quinone oxidoreductase subunit G n=1 Tax=Kineosporia sp. R_H_3 TaxID=1961848 RepID=UPI000B4A616A|nr:NADH-quinone oxidoreductase subunit G [Kineosporia sp. R_H_3]
MTVTANPPSGSPTPPAPDLVTVTIDDVEVSVPKGTLVIRAAEEIGIAIPRFCDHPLLAPAGACRQCLVEVATPGPDGSLRPMPKPQASCTLEVSPGMVVRTQQTSPVAEKAQRGVMELLLINHPLDCPVCDKGGECPLQNQAMANGQASTRFTETKRTFPKPIRISTQVLLDRERCVLCQRCTRFSKEIAGDPFIDLQMRGAKQQIGTFSPTVLGFHSEVPTQGDAMLDESGQPFASYFSGNTVQICPVGALTGAAYRFRSRPFDLVSTPGVCEHCASGCAIRVDHRRGSVLRRLADDDPAVNEEWNCDKGRWAFQYAGAADRITTPLVRDEETGELRTASWPEALDVAAKGLAAAKAGSGAAVLTGGRVTVEDAYAYAKFARVALGTNDVDFRARPHSAEEAAFLAHAVAGAGLGVTYADLQAAPQVLLVGLEPEEESPIVFLRLRKAVAKGQVVHAVAPWRSRGLAKLGAALLPAAPSTEAEVLDAVATGAPEVAAAAEGLRTPGAVILVGERLAGVPGALSAAVRLATATGARLAWVPRRAGERGAVEAGALPNLLPGGRPVTEAGARIDVAAAWDVQGLPVRPGRDTAGILAAAAAGDLGALVVGGVDPADLPDPALATEALRVTPFVVSLELRASAVTEHADVVLPVAPVQEKAGTFVDWEGRWRHFGAALASNAMSDFRVLDSLADAMDVVLGLRTVDRVRGEIAELDAWEGERADAPSVSAAEPPQPGPGEAVLATWHLLLDNGRLQDGEPYLAGTAHRAVARLSAATAAEAGVADGEPVTVATRRGAVTLPAVVTPMPDRVVWLPANSPGSAVRATLGADAGGVVTLSRTGADA